jgi:hypothetical protein
MMHSLSFAKLDPDLTGGIKNCGSIAFNNGFSEAHTQTRQADSTHQLSFKPKNRNRQSGDIRITLAQTEIVPGLSCCME